MNTTENAPPRGSEGALSGKTSADATVAAREPLWTREFGLLCLVNVLAMGGFTTLMPTLPLYVQRMGGQESAIGLIMGIFALSALAARPWSGRWIDRAGRRGIYLLSLGCAIPVFLAYIVVPPTIPWLGGLRLVHGLSWGIMTTAGATIITDAVPVTRRGEGIGYYGTIVTLTTVAAPSAGIALVDHFGFTGLFLVNAGVALLAVLVARTVHYRPVPAKVEGPMGGYFERRALPPSAIALCTYFAQAAVVTFIAVYALDRGVANIGLYFAISALTVVLMRPLAGRLYDERGPALVLVPSLLMIVVAMLVLAVGANLEMFLLAAVLMGAGLGACQPTMQAMAVDGVPAERRGAANCTYWSALDISMASGSIMLGAVAQAFGYPLMYVVTSAMVACGVVIFGILRPTKSAVVQPS